MAILLNANTETVTVNTYAALSSIAIYNPENSEPYLAITYETRGGDGEPKDQKTVIFNYDPAFTVDMINPIDGTKLDLPPITIDQLYSIAFSVLFKAINTEAVTAVDPAITTDTTA